MKQRIAIDMDEVMVDTLAERLARYQTQFGEELPLAGLSGVKFHEAVQEDRRDAVEGHLRSPGFFRHLTLMPGAREVIQELMESYEVFITTAAMEYPNSFTEKYEWIKEHLPFFPDSHIVFCGDKSIIHADFLIDDTPHHFSRFAGQGILFAAPRNVDETRYPRVNNWEDVRERFLSRR